MATAHTMPKRSDLACTHSDKERHPCKRTAASVRRRMIRQAKEAGDRQEWVDSVTLQIYKCAGHFHLGHFGRNGWSEIRA